MEETHKDTLKPTEVNKTEVFNDKYNGMSSYELAIKYNLNLNTLKDYFALDGNWRNDYQAFERDLNEEALLIAKRNLSRSITKACSTLVGLLESNNENVALKASVEILDRFFSKNIELTQKAPDNAFSKLMSEIREEVLSCKKN